MKIIKYCWFDRYYILCMIMACPFIIWLNYDATGMQNLYPIYPEFTKIIKAGFDLGVTSIPRSQLTFPMWGYGWFLLLTQNKLLILIIQNLFALSALWSFLYMLEKRKIFSLFCLRFIKYIMLISIPWYAFHSLRWPYSIAISLFLYSFLFFYEGFQRDRYWLGLIIFSGIFFGLLLNFRSDYIFMPIGFVVIGLFLNNSIVNVKKMSLWLICIYGLLIPWAFFTKKVCGHYLLTSTNGGYVVLQGLGNLSNNKWGFQDHDGCFKIHELVEGNFKEKYPLYVYEKNRFLQSYFLQLIQKEPLEYAKKCIYTLYKMITEGVYYGEFFTRNSSPSFFEVKKGFMTRPLDYCMKHPLQVIRLCLSALAKRLGIIIVLLSILMIPFSLYSALFKREAFFIFMLFALGYQIAMNVLFYHRAALTSNMYFFFILNIFYGLLSVQNIYSNIINAYYKKNKTVIGKG